MAATSTTKRCPGFEGIAQAPHDVAADLEHFKSNAGNADGLSTRCKACSKAYQSAWRARAQAVAKADAVSPSLAGGVTRDQALDEANRPVAEYARGFRPTLPLVASLDEAQLTEVIASGLEHLLRKYRGSPGWAVEVVAGVEYIVPDGKVAGTPDGQAALEGVNAAIAAERRRRDAERKRNERAAKKQAAAATA